MKQRCITTVAAVTLALGLPASLSARQATPPTESSETTGRISVTWTEAPIRDVLRAFAAYSGRSIVAGNQVTGFVAADINDQPWDVALQTILSGRGLIGVRDLGIGLSYPFFRIRRPSSSAI